MINGILHWNNKNIRYSQNKNASDNMIKKVLSENNILTKYNWLEMCGISAFCTIIEGMGFIIEKDYPDVLGLGIQLDDYLAMFMNDPKNDHIFSGGNTFDNRVMRNYKTLFAMMFKYGIAVYSEWTWESLTAEIFKGNGALICKKKPGHYVAAIAYDNKKDIILTSDPNSESIYLKHGGWHEEITKEEFELNIHKWAIVFRK